MLQVKDYRVSYGQSEVVHGVNFELKKNEIVAIMGRNGMGKTSLMKSLVGMVPESGGSISLQGTDLTGMKSFERVANGVGFVPQGRMIFSTMSVLENIETGLTSTNQSKLPPDSDLYELFPVLKEMKSRKGGNLSGGQQQQLAIARALASNPKVLILDEPTEGIQPSIIKEMARTLKRIRDERGLSILVSEQVLSFALEIADRVLVIEGGNIVHEDDIANIDEDKVASYLSV
ncbi:urea ABC transporter ATP-binding subunit UrtE [Gayadomonas joobiniege]|uniref:urea ABC transporter ATP-binding subunit UrtE n=1 Tax=Gayadomonas joobiniege TaxID=1234606 RepID=UPI00036F42B4|nr:urea ABC transporter ATP-binding subunit UrtE [Gayadomonas joobiniege]